MEGVLAVVFDIERRGWGTEGRVSLKGDEQTVAFADGDGVSGGAIVSDT